MKVWLAFFKNRWLALGASILILSVAYYIDNYRQKAESNYEELTRTLQTHLHNKEKAIEKLLANDSFLNSFIKDGFSLEGRKRLDKRDFTLMVYKDTSLVFWSDNEADPDVVREKKSEEIDALKTNNGWYLHKTRKIGRHSFVLLYRFYTRYQYQNRYLRSSFAPDAGIKNTAEISPKPVQDFAPVKSIYGKKLFYLALHPYTHNSFTIPVVVLTLLGLWLFFIFLSNQYEWFLDSGRTLAGTLFFALVLILVKILIVDLKFPSFLQSSLLFDPGVYASSGLFSSLGALLVNVVLLFVFVFTLSKQMASTKDDVSVTPKNFKSALLFIPAFFVLIVFTGFIINIIRSLIIDSNIPFDIANIFHFTWFSLIGLLITSLLVSIHFFSSSMVYQLMKRLQLSNRLFFINGIAAVGLYAAYQLIVSQWQPSLLVQAPAYAFAIIIVLQLSKDLKIAQRTLGYVLVVSVFVALLFYRFNIDKEHEIRKLYAIQLSDSKDIEAENTFTDIEHQIANDPRIFSYFTNAIFSKRDLEKHINQLYFTGYLGKYDVEIFDYDTIGNFFRENNYYTYEFVNTLYNSHSQPTLSNYFYYIVYPSVQYSYIAKYDYCAGKHTMGSLFILLKRKLTQDPSLFTQLLSQSNSDNKTPPYNYSYALYQNDKLVNKGGKYSYSLNLTFDTTEREEFVVSDGYSHHIKREPNNLIVVVSKKVDSVLQPLAVFSFLFLMLLLFIALLFAYNGLVVLIRAGLAYYTGKWKSLYRLHHFARWLIPIRRMRGLLFSTRIQVTIFSLVSAILLLSGYIFLRYIDYKYTERQRDKMVQKIKSVSGAFENRAQLEMQLMLPTELTAFVNQIGDSYETDINFYNVDGHLVTSTKNKIYTSGLVARQIHPEAFVKLQKEAQSFYIHDEKIGSLKYISAYVPVLDAKHTVIAYLNLPFFTNEAELNDEISAFFVNFVNLYILFFLVAALIAYLITQRVTAPLTIIQNKLSKLSLSSKNEVIEWTGDDEIGELVAQYNKMLVALEESAGRLAQSEREGAWREMAKQIAHEIKNPLTPMKLSVQHLQRAWAAKGDNLDDTFKRVTQVLIEQIDSLSNLASEFSAFAKMPEPVSERLELNELVLLTATLYETTENLSVSFFPLPVKAYINGDKDQLSRVLTNIITNAIQAIPEENQGKIEIRIVHEGSIYKIEVSDNGKGIPDDEANKVFIPSFSTKNSGMGLGLAISKKIVEGMGGKIYFVSQVGIGTTFFVELPKIEAPAE